MPIPRGPLDVTIEAEPLFLEQDGIKLNEGKHFYVLEYEHR